MLDVSLCKALKSQILFNTHDNPLRWVLSSSLALLTVQDSPVWLRGEDRLQDHSLNLEKLQEDLLGMVGGGRWLLRACRHQGGQLLGSWIDFWPRAPNVGDASKEGAAGTWERPRQPGDSGTRLRGG